MIFLTVFFQSNHILKGRTFNYLQTHSPFPVLITLINALFPTLEKMSPYSPISIFQTPVLKVFFQKDVFLSSGLGFLTICRLLPFVIPHSWALHISPDILSFSSLKNLGVEHRALVVMSPQVLFNECTADRSIDNPWEVYTFTPTWDNPFCSAMGTPVF